MTDRHRVALQGFSAFERNALASCFRLSHGATPGYEPVDGLAQADFVVADADHPGVIDALQAAGRVGDTVFVGAQAPEGAAAWMMRPIDPLYVLRELDAMAALRHPSPAPAPSRRSAPREAPGRRSADASARAPADASFDAAAIDASPPLAAALRGEVLIVDDSEVALRLLERELPLLGLTTQRARTSAEAFERLAAHRFDAVILDVELGDDSELDGLALCQRLKRAHRELGTKAPVVVLLTVHGEPVNRVRGTLAGCDAYLAKPLDVQVLASTLRGLGLALTDATPPAAPQP
jgi:CheY-like chemotaxis protein